MVGFLIATHGGFARGILDSIELIAGKQERIDTISILHETSIDVFGKEMCIRDSFMTSCQLLFPIDNPVCLTIMSRVMVCLLYTSSA